MSLCPCVCLFLKISLIAGPLWLSYTVKLLKGPGKVTILREIAPEPPPPLQKREREREPN